MGRLKDKLIWFLARRIESVPYFMASMVGERFDLARLVRQTDDPMPARLCGKRLPRPLMRKESGTYIHGNLNITVGARFAALQAIQAKDTVKALAAFYSLRKWQILAGRFGKVNRLAFHMAKDLEAREKRDRELQTPLTDLQRQAGYGDLRHGLFGVMDYIALRNGLKYNEVEQLADVTLYRILKIDHDKAMVQRNEMRLRMEESKRQAKIRRRR